MPYTHDDINTAGKILGESKRSQTSAPALRKYLKQRIIGQDSMIDAVVDVIHCANVRKAAIDDGIDPLDLPKQQPILVISGTGTGKTFLFQNLAQAVDADLVFIDASSLTGRGWRGMSVDEALLPLAENQANHPGKLQIVVWDEFDKIGLFSHGANVDPSFNPAKDLLKVLDGDFVDIYSEAASKDRGVSRVDLKTVFHVFAGAFTGIEQIASNRLSPQSKLGFTSEMTTIQKVENSRLEVASEDLEEWGLPRELVGRIGQIVSMPALTEKTMRSILVGGEHSIEACYQRMLGRAGIAFSISDGACSSIAKAAVESGLGARYLASSLVEPVARSIASADEQSATSISIVKLQNGEISFELGGINNPKPEGWTLGPMPSAGQSDPRGQCSLRELEREALVNSINSSVGRTDVFHGFKNASQFYKAASLLLAPQTDLPHPHDAEAAVDVLAPIMMLMFDRYAEVEHSFGNIYTLLDGFDDEEGAYFGAIAQTAITEAEEEGDSERIAWYSNISREFEAFRARNSREQNHAVADARFTLRRLAYDKEEAARVRRAFGYVRTSLP